jgi:hypothetical protein
MEVVPMNAIPLARRMAAHSTLTGFVLLMLSTAPFAEPGPIKPPADRVPAVWLGPQALDPAEAGIGRQIPDLAVRAIDGSSHSLHLANGRRGTVVVVRDPGCPVSRSYGPRISRMARHYAEAGFGFVFIYPSETLNSEQRRKDQQTLGVPGIFVDKGSYAVADELGVKSTGDVFVLDNEYRVRYRGAVDDQYGLGYTRDLPTRHYLRNALDALKEGRKIATPATAAPGCYIDADPAKNQLTWPLAAGQMLSRLVAPHTRLWSNI